MSELRCKSEGCPLLQGSRVQTALLCKKYHQQLIEPLRDIARGHGYAIGVHGSLARDIDYMVVPWAENVLPIESLATAIEDYLAENSFKPHFQAVERRAPKPHSRVCYTWVLEDRCYIDMSIFVPSQSAESE